MKKRYWIVGLGSFVVTLALFLTLLFPLWDKRFDVFDLYGKDDDLVPLAAPVYGVIPAAVTDSIEWDQQEGVTYGQRNTVRVNDSEYYLIVNNGDAGTDNDGFAVTIQVDDDTGLFWTNTANLVISRFEFDNSDGYSANVQHIPGTDKYVVAYDDKTGAKVTLVTLQVWDNNGTIRQAVIDTQQCSQQTTSATYYNLAFLGITDNVYAVVYTETGSSDGFIETWTVNDNGTIDNAYNDRVEYDTTYSYHPYICLVDSDTVAISYVSGSLTGSYTVKTLDISSVGDISAVVDTWSYETEPNLAQSGSSFIEKVGNEMFVVGFVVANTVVIKTIPITNAGSITEAFTDTATMFSGTVAKPAYLNPFFVNDPKTASSGNGVMGYVMREDSTNTYTTLTTFNISSAGVIGDSRIDYLRYTVGNAYTGVVYVNQSWYVFCQGGGGNDGWSYTINILTNWASPVVSNVQPVNYAVGVGLQPSCNITINDANGDNMDVMWEEFVGASWVHMQDNLSVGNGTYRWVYSDANAYSTMYIWRVHVSDGFHNDSHVYVFTTMDMPSQKTHWEYLFNSSLSGGNNTTGFSSLFTSGLTGGNISSIDSLFTSSLTGGNVSSYDSLFTSSLSGGNISSYDSLFTSSLTGGNNITGYSLFFISSLSGGNITVGYSPLFTASLTGGNISGYHSLFTSSLTGGNITSFVPLFTSSLSGGNITGAFYPLFISSLTGGNVSNVTIFLSNETPVSGSVVLLSLNSSNLSGHSGDIWMSIQRNHSMGLPMNTTIWFNGTLVFVNLSWGNGTLGFWLFDVYGGSLVSGVMYNWSVNCSVNVSDFVNETYSFVCNVVEGFIAVSNRLVLGIVLGGVMFSVVGMILFDQRRRKRE